jgi:hypothetical protein
MVPGIPNGEVCNNRTIIKQSWLWFIPLQKDKRLWIRKAIFEMHPMAAVDNDSHADACMLVGLLFAGKYGIEAYFIRLNCRYCKYSNFFVAVVMKMRFMAYLDKKAVDVEKVFSVDNLDL